MVSFTCDICHDVVKKKAVESHCMRGPCRNAYVLTCIDCSQTFEGNEYIKHTQCISEEDKYYGPYARSAIKKNLEAQQNKTEKQPKTTHQQIKAQNELQKVNNLNKQNKIDENFNTATQNNKKQKKNKQDNTHSNISNQKNNYKYQHLNTSTQTQDNKVLFDSHNEKQQNSSIASINESNTTDKQECTPNISPITWKGTWIETIKSALKSQPDNKIKYQKLVEILIPAYLKHKPEDKSDFETLSTLCLSNVPDNFVSFTDEYIYYKN